MKSEKKKKTFFVVVSFEINDYIFEQLATGEPQRPEKSSE